MNHLLAEVEGEPVLNETTNLNSYQIDYTSVSSVSTQKFMENESDFAPDFRMWGNLDVQSVKIISQLNDDLVAKLDACATYEDLEALVEEMAIFLATDPATSAQWVGPPSTDEFTILEDIVAKYSHSGYLYTPDADDQPLYVIHRLLSDYTSTEKVKYKHYLLDGNSGNLNWKSGDYVDIQSRDKPNSSDLKTEPYTYLDTPYQIYYKYCQQNGYLPPEPETEATA